MRRRLSSKQKEIVAEYLANIAVAWFAAGVISVFIGNLKGLTEIILSIGWGIILSLMFLWSSVYMLKSG